MPLLGFGGRPSRAQPGTNFKRYLADMRPSRDGASKYTVLVIDMDTPGMPRKVIRFGARGYEDYTTHGDPARRKLYLARHQPREDWSDVWSPGFWARWILWGPHPSVVQNQRYVSDHFSVDFARAWSIRRLSDTE
jgi:hypothetical protein